MRRYFSALILILFLFSLSAADQFHNHDHLIGHDCYSCAHEEHCPVFSLKMNLPDLPGLMIPIETSDMVEEFRSRPDKHPHLIRFKTDIDSRAPPLFC
jgi:hypothetical protein